MKKDRAPRGTGSQVQDTSAAALRASQSSARAAWVAAGIASLALLLSAYLTLVAYLGTKELPEVSLIQRTVDYPTTLLEFRSPSADPNQTVTGVLVIEWLVLASNNGDRTLSLVRYNVQEVSVLHGPIDNPYVDMGTRSLTDTGAQIPMEAFHLELTGGATGTFILRTGLTLPPSVYDIIRRKYAPGPIPSVVELAEYLASQGMGFYTGFLPPSDPVASRPEQEQPVNLNVVFTTSASPQPPLYAFARRPIDLDEHIFRITLTTGRGTPASSFAIWKPPATAARP